MLNGIGLQASLLQNIKKKTFEIIVVINYWNSYNINRIIL